MLDGSWRAVVDRGLTPIGRSLRRTGITADVVTIIGIAMAAAASMSIGLGYLRLGFLLLVLTGVPDALDGAVAKASGTSSSRGAFFDSVADRLTDALLFGGVAWYLAGSREDRMMMLPVAIMATAMFISYQRAKAESLGYDAKGGLMERAERFIVLAFGLLFAEILIPVLWVMLVLSLVTAAQRFAKVWRQASAGRESPSQRRSERRRQLRSERRQRLGSRRRPVRR
ncbi:MAG: CDP-alcohol phosphatidyltransferase [Acidimicrobiaceae bacterium]|nr:CDP-alcohol phosphatidyltransferase [Acidimicrobiaceae bacterium]HAQ22178.1 CDP-alcohol phosphatidyltransferase [Acidimicrobiaceae bacterium]|tara:strand:+ start:934 stop:1614 length:681 start_codon:yes stop_codon:yes gene_type:complete